MDCHRLFPLTSILVFGMKKVRTRSRSRSHRRASAIATLSPASLRMWGGFGHVHRPSVRDGLLRGNEFKAVHMGTGTAAREVHFGAMALAEQALEFIRKLNHVERRLNRRAQTEERSSRW
jgi:hypothetical protein